MDLPCRIMYNKYIDVFLRTLTGADNSIMQKLNESLKW